MRRMRDGSNVVSFGKDTTFEDEGEEFSRRDSSYSKYE